MYTKNVNMYAYVYSYICICMWIYFHRYTHIITLTYMYVKIDLCTYIYIIIHIYIYIYIFIYIYICMYIYVRSFGADSSSACLSVLQRVAEWCSVLQVVSWFMIGAGDLASHKFKRILDVWFLFYFCYFTFCLVVLPGNGANLSSALTISQFKHEEGFSRFDFRVVWCF